MSWEEAARRVREKIAALPITEAEKAGLTDAVTEMARACIRQMAADAKAIIGEIFYGDGA